MEARTVLGTDVSLAAREPGAVRSDTVRPGALGGSSEECASSPGRTNPLEPLLPRLVERLRRRRMEGSSLR